MATFDIYKTVADWLVPVVLTLAIRSLSQTTKRLTEISTTLAVVVNQISEINRRVAKLEDRDD